MPSFRPILRIPSPLALNSSIRASTEGLTRRRPSLVPFALARARPALTLSRINTIQLDPRELALVTDKLSAKTYPVQDRLDFVSFLISPPISRDARGSAE